MKFILPHIPLEITEFREPFVGGGSVFSAFKQTAGILPIAFWINDLNYDLYCFWKMARDRGDELVKTILEFRENYSNGRELYSYFTNQENEYSDFDRAVRFFILNRITFSGVVDSGGYSQKAFENRFTLSSVERLKELYPLLFDIKITHGDYESLLMTEGKNVFIFLDPPYWKATKSKLYGVKGDLHTSFDHERFANCLKKCQHRWLVTYDDSPKIRELFDFATIIEWELQYGMNNYKQGSAAKGKELLIKNY
ncbi:MAG: DNA adenine methylase [Halothece sp.]